MGGPGITRLCVQVPNNQKQCLSQVWLMSRSRSCSRAAVGPSLDLCSCSAAGGGADPARQTAPEEEEVVGSRRSDLSSSDENGPELPENTTLLWRPVGLFFFGPFWKLPPGMLTGYQACCTVRVRQEFCFCVYESFIKLNLFPSSLPQSVSFFCLRNQTGSEGLVKTEGGTGCSRESLTVITLV